MQQFIKMRKQVSMTESTRLVLNKSIDLLHKLSNGKMSKEGVKKEITVLLSTYFVTVYPDNDRGIDADKKLKLEHFLEQAYTIVEQVDSGKAPLYEAIMLMNKVVVSLKPPEDESVEEESIEEAEAEAEAEAEEEAEEEEEEEEEEIDSEPEARVTKREVMRFRPVVSEIDGDIFHEELTEERVEESMAKTESYEPRKVEKIVAESGESVTDLIGDVLKQQKALEDSITHLNESLNRIGFELRPLK